MTPEHGPAYVPYSVFLEWSDRFRKDLTREIERENDKTLAAIATVQASVVNVESESRLATREKVKLNAALFGAIGGMLIQLYSALHN